MPILTLPGPLLRFVGETACTNFSGRSAQLDAATWTELVEIVRERYPTLASHVIDEDGTIRNGIILVINGCVADGYPTYLTSTDQVSFIAQISGG